MYGDQERLYTKETIVVKNVQIETYVHNNGIIIVPNTESNCANVKTLEISDIQKMYTILDEKEEKPATTSYKKSLYILKKRANGPRQK
ncbi:hypothetical protein NEMIN01_2177 [Nematocida minor]|uniref:uncharacterized protein n=1 Tax=Nematocida minor TaxID=1912983 RepID=UPI0022208813|nr:uncharacterized protein NEMIN01_2177 [Nematocida minor]KAI5192732.1 hypothetical protein NEMIN01_2177 [Nematocida minor]